MNPAKPTDSNRPGAPRARWGLFLIIVCGLSAALMLLAREDHRYELQEKRLLDIKEKIAATQEHVSVLQAEFETHDERAKDFIEYEQTEDAK